MKAHISDLLSRLSSALGSCSRCDNIDPKAFGEIHADVAVALMDVIAVIPTKCLVCKRPVFSKLIEDVLFVGNCSHCAAQDERDAARASWEAAMAQSNARDERDW